MNQNLPKKESLFVKKREKTTVHHWITVQEKRKPMLRPGAVGTLKNTVTPEMT